MRSLTTSAADRVDIAGTPVQNDAALQRSQRLSAERLLPPGHVPGFEIERLLGEGSFGSVWLARELKTGKQVAIKFYTQRRGLNWSLLSREVEKLAVLYTSRNIVGLLDVGWDHDPPYFVMEYLEAGSLDARLRAGTIPVEDAVRYATAIARALTHAHRSGILHCDLKPANVLLDANSEPRLGDFGQSRLTTEQSPSLGTLFYMAPEQAVVDGVPDVRWDVYALGALLYHMLTGAPPYAGPESERRLREARSLPLRLEVYRNIIRQNPTPDAHRGVPGVDYALADLIDGCLERDPARRIPTVQGVVDRLERREQRRSRRTLVALGFLGPILFLLAMYWIAESAVPHVVAAAEQNLIDRALGSDVVSARILAESVQQELHSREAELVELARQPELQQLLSSTETLSERELVELSRGGDAGSQAAARAFTWMQRTTAEAEEHLVQENRTADDSWFVTDAGGRQIYRWPLPETGWESTLGRSFHWRDYFHGQGRDLDPQTPPAGLAPRAAPGVSAPFRSQATGRYMVAIAVPIRGEVDGSTLGVLARTIRLTELLRQWEVRLHDGSSTVEAGATDPNSRFLALADARSGGVQLLDHPGLSSPHMATAPDTDWERYLRVDPAQAAALQSRQRFDRYQDPFAALDKTYRGDWLAAAALVGDTGWLAIVQERRDSTVQPVDNLRRVFLRAGYWSLGVFSALLVLMWYLLHRASV